MATYSIKGGVGKTTSAVNLAYEAACAGTRVLLWDLDPQGAATYFFRIRPGMKGGSERLAGKRGDLAGLVRGTDVRGLDVVPADFTLRHLDLHLDDRKRPTAQLADGRKRLHRELMADLGAAWPQFLEARVPQAAVVERMGPERAPLATFAASSPAARAFGELWAEIATRLWPPVTSR